MTIDECRMDASLSAIIFYYKIERIPQFVIRHSTFDILLGLCDIATFVFHISDPFTNLTPEVMT
jgi:hypothetical protein